jgi:hypothetical protein
MSEYSSAVIFFGQVCRMGALRYKNKKKYKVLCGVQYKFITQHGFVFSLPLNYFAHLCEFVECTPTRFFVFRGSW